MRRKGEEDIIISYSVSLFQRLLRWRSPLDTHATKKFLKGQKRIEQIIHKKKDPKKIWVYCRIQALPSGGEDRPKIKKREFSRFFAWGAWGFVILQIPLFCSLISAYLYIQLFLFYFFSTLHFFRFDFLFEQFFSPPSVSARQINKYNKNGMAPISKYTRSVKPYLPI